ncbi:unnamed protein product [Rhizoctonia solani]|uniref:Uncharacterized protein n=1 Tax=Rhizoctonia solani TaxID=456999 RepID=A0A8H2W988_9AGAM|nr:unnamed protein product [Rhizoctonia solani]
MAARTERKVRTCCCCIPVRAGVGILAWLYFLGGTASVVLAVMILKQDTSDMEIGVKALVIALGSLSAFLVITSMFGIIATIGQSPRFARIWSIMFQIWYYLQLALDIAVIALFFSKKLDSLIVECTSLAAKRRPKGSEIENCNRGRNRLSLFYTLSGVVRNAIGYYFTRRVSSFTRHCAERSANRGLAAPAQMTAISGRVNVLNVQGGHQASADSLQGAKAV